MTPTLTGHPAKPVNYELSDLYRCQSWPQHGGRCPWQAEGTLHAPDGQIIPGGYYCARHGEATVSEYREKLGETWFFRPFDTTPNVGTPADLPTI